MGKYYFTFGQSHAHRVNNIIFDKDCVVEIEAEDYGSAREKMFDNFNDKWSFQYVEIPDMGYFPRGIFKL